MLFYHHFYQRYILSYRTALPLNTMCDDSVLTWVTQTFISSNKSRAMSHCRADIERGGWICFLKVMGIRSCTEGCYHDNTHYLPRARHNEAGTLESNFADHAVMGGGRFIRLYRTGCILTGNKDCTSSNIIQKLLVTHKLCIKSGRYSKYHGQPKLQPKKN